MHEIAAAALWMVVLHSLLYCTSMESVVRVKCISGEEFSVSLTSGDMSVSELRQHISTQRHIPVDNIKLIYRGKVLKDQHTLQYYHINNNNVIHLVIRNNNSTQTNVSQPLPSPSPASAQPSAAAANIIQIDFAASDDNAQLPDINSIVGNVIQSLQHTSAPGGVQQITAVQHAYNAMNHAVTQDNALNNLQDNAQDLVALLRHTAHALQTYRERINNIADHIQLEQKQHSAENRTSMREEINTATRGLRHLSQGTAAVARILSAVQVPDGDAPISLNIPQPTVRIQAVANDAMAPGTNPLAGVLNIVGQILRPPSGAPSTSESSNTTIQTSGADTVADTSHTTTSTPSTSNSNPNGSQSGGPSAGAGQTARPIPAGLDISGMLSVMQSLTANASRVSEASRPIAPSGSQPTSSQSTPSPPQLDFGNLISSMMTGMATQSGGPAPSITQSLFDGQGSFGFSADSQGIEGLLGFLMENLSIPDMFSFVSGNWTPLDRVRPRVRERTLQMLNGDRNEASIRTFSESIAQNMAEMINQSDLSAEFSSHILPGGDIQKSCEEALIPEVLALVRILVSDETNSNPQWFSSLVKAQSSRIVGCWVEALSRCFDNGSSSAYPLVQNMALARLSSFGPEMAMFSGIGSTMISSVIRSCHTSYIQGASPQSAISSTSQSSTSSSDDLLNKLSGSNLNNVERSEIVRIIETDEKRQAAMDNQKPFSDSYVSGNSSKKRKTSDGGVDSSVSSSTPLDLSSALDRQVRNLLGSSSGSSSSVPGQLLNSRGEVVNVDRIISQTSGLTQLYRDTLIEGLAARVSSDADFETGRFPETESKILGKRKADSRG